MTQKLEKIFFFLNTLKEERNPLHAIEKVIISQLLLNKKTMCKCKRIDKNPTLNKMKLRGKKIKCWD